MKRPIPKPKGVKKRQSGNREARSVFSPKRIRIPHQVQSAGELWLEFFGQFCDLVVDNHETWNTRKDMEAIDRARILADRALAAFQDRFPGVYPND